MFSIIHKPATESMFPKFVVEIDSGNCNQVISQAAQRRIFAKWKYEPFYFVSF